MVDAVGTIAKVIEAALKLKKAADTVKQNEDLCKQIISRVDILSNSLSQHQNNRELMNNLAVRVALEALDGTLGEALKLVMDCQEENNIVCLFYNSGNLSQRLKEVEQHISSKNMDAMFAIMGFLLPKQFNQHGAGAHPQPQQVYPASTQAPLQSQTMQPPNLPKQMSRQHNQDRGDVNVQTDDEPYPYAEIFRHARAERNDYGEHNIPAFGDWDYSMTKKPVVSTDDVVSEWDSSMVALCSCCAMAKKSKPARQRPGLPLRSLLQEIAAVALEVNEAAETVLQNKDDCIEIGKRMSSVSAILSQLEGTEMLEEHAMDRALNKLLMNFRDERRLVLQCQSSGIAAMFFCSPPSKLSKQLRVELDAMVSDINAIIAVIVNHTLDPQRNARGQPQAPPSVQPARVNDLPEYWVGPPHRLST